MADHNIQIPHIVIRQAEMQNFYRSDGSYSFEIPVHQVTAIGGLTYVPVTSHVTVTDIGQFIPTATQPAIHLQEMQPVSNVYQAIPTSDSNPAPFTTLIPIYSSLSPTQLQTPVHPPPSSHPHNLLPSPTYNLFLPHPQNPPPLPLPLIPPHPPQTSIATTETEVAVFSMNGLSSQNTENAVFDAGRKSLYALSGSAAYDGGGMVLSIGEKSFASLEEHPSQNRAETETDAGRESETSTGIGTGGKDSDMSRNKTGISIGAKDTSSGEERPVFTCDHCSATFKRANNLKIHVQRHLGIKPFACSECPATFVEEKNLKRHMVCHIQERRYVCQECGLSFVESSNMIRHMLTHAGDANFVCHTCGASFSKAHHLKDHMSQHREGAADARHLCQECQQVFNNPFQLRKHIRSVHTAGTGSRGKGGNYACPECGSVFGWWSIYRRHLLTHRGQKPFVCSHPDCGEGFLDNVALRQHKRTHARNVRSNVCDICSAAFDRPSHLLRHRRSHTGERPNVCVECGAAFVERNKLQRHMRIHGKPTTNNNTNTAPAKGENMKGDNVKGNNFIREEASAVMCDTCGATFSQQRHLTRHVKLHHEAQNQEPESCKPQNHESEIYDGAELPSTELPKFRKSRSYSRAEPQSLRTERLKNKSTKTLLRGNSSRNAQCDIIKEEKDDVEEKNDEVERKKGEIGKESGEEEERDLNVHSDRFVWDTVTSSRSLQKQTVKRHTKMNEENALFNVSKTPKRCREFNEENAVKSVSRTRKRSTNKRKRVKRKERADDFEMNEEGNFEILKREKEEEEDSERNEDNFKRVKRKKRGDECEMNQEDRKPKLSQIKQRPKTRQRNKNKMDDRSTKDNRKKSHKNHRKRNDVQRNERNNDTDSNARHRNYQRNSHETSEMKNDTENKLRNRNKRGSQCVEMPSASIKKTQNVSDNASDQEQVEQIEGGCRSQGHSCRREASANSLNPPVAICTADATIADSGYSMPPCPNMTAGVSCGETPIASNRDSQTIFVANSVVVPPNESAVNDCENAKHCTKYGNSFELVSLQNGPATNFGMASNENGSVTSFGMAPNQNGSVTSFGMAPNQNDSLSILGMAPNQNGSVINSGMAPNQNGPVPNLGIASNQNGSVTNLGTTPKQNGSVPNLGIAPNQNGPVPTKSGMAPNQATHCASSEPEQFKHQRAVDCLGSDRATAEQDGGSLLYACPMCNALFNSTFSLKLHKRVHRVKENVCLRCGKNFGTAAQLDQHRVSCLTFPATKDGDRNALNNKVHGCSKCGAAFSDQNKLKLHARFHSDTRKHMCSVCGASFSKSCDLSAHTRTHTLARPYVCGACGASYTQASTLSVHARTHSGLKPYVCKVCSAAFPRAGRLKVHMRCHSNEKPCVCSVCHMTFKWSQTLLRHMKAVHTEAPYSCTRCSLTFQQERKYKSHLQMHEGLRPHQCSDCPLAFKKKVELTRHTRVHTRNFPFLCDECGSGFGSAASLKIHRRCHSDERPWVCHVCGRGFRISSHLTRHMTTHSHDSAVVVVKKN